MRIFNRNRRYHYGEQEFERDEISLSAIIMLVGFLGLSLFCWWAVFTGGCE